jgi:hypothetical protein
MPSDSTTGSGTTGGTADPSGTGTTNPPTGTGTGTGSSQ